ncbi:MAG: hypothetical protein ACXWW2_10660, partial [Candidatus Deferrimicrobiaceae bacterium]
MAVDDGVDDGLEREGVDKLRDPRLPKERLPPIRANASTVMNRNTATEIQTAATTNVRFFMVPPESDDTAVARYREAPSRVNLSEARIRRSRSGSTLKGWAGRSPVNAVR